MKAPLYGWQIVMWIPVKKRDGSKLKTVTIIVAETFEQVLKYLKADRMDAQVEIETIQRFGPIIKIIQT